jgi:hypothetical protein
MVKGLLDEIRRDQETIVQANGGNIAEPVPMINKWTRPFGQAHSSCCMQLWSA